MCLSGRLLNGEAAGAPIGEPVLAPALELAASGTGSWLPRVRSAGEGVPVGTRHFGQG